MSVDDPGLPVANWRPTRTTSAASALVAVAATLALAAVGGATGPTGLGMLAGSCLAGAVWATAVAERRLATLVAGALATLGGLGLLAALLGAVLLQVSWPPTLPMPFLAFAPFALAFAGVLTGFGALASLWGVSPGEEAGVAANRLCVVSLVPVAALLLDQFDPTLDPAFELVGAAADLVLAREGPVVAGGTAGPRVTGFLLLVALTALAVRVALGSLPLVELADEARRDAVADDVGRYRTVLGWLAGVCGPLGVAAVAFGPERYAALLPGLRPTLITVTTSTGLRWLLVGVVLANACAALVPRLVRAAASERFRPTFLPVALLLAGGSLVAVALLLDGPLARFAVGRASSDAGRRFLQGLFETVGTVGVALAVVVLGLALATLLLLVVRVLGSLHLLGEPTGVQLASAGILVAAVGAAISGAHVVLVVGGVAASLLAWDLGEFAATLGEEVGRRGTTRHGELVHAAGAVVLACLAGVVAVGANAAVALVPSVPVHVAVLVTAAAVLGTILLFVVSR